MSPILSLPGVCVFPERPENAARGVAYPHYIYQVLTHAGVAYCKVEPDDLGNSLAELSLLVTIGEASLSSELQDSLRDWVHSGGAWLSIAGLCGLEDLFGVSYAPPAYSGAWGGNPVSTLGEGYLTPDAAEHPVLAHLNIPLHFFNGLALQAGPLEPEHSDNNASKSQTDYLAHSLDAHGRETTRIALAEHKVGKGRCLVLAPDAIGAVVRIQQGVTVTRDGVPAPDGTAPVSDGVLKCGDGGVLDWYFDRQDIPGVPGLKGFLEPIADQWRELVLRALFYLGAKQGTSFPVLWLYPRNLPALGHLSLDTDHNDPALGAELLRVLAEASVPATWCVIAPGYEHNLLQKIEADRHELAMHYDAMSQGCPWSEELFEKQWQYLSHLFGEQPVTNKNHYTRWEGDTEFFDWCSKRAIELDQSKGPSKTGEVGFPFGSCHPYFPVAPNGELIDVLELPLHTQDFQIFVPKIVLEQLLAATLRHHGVLHLLFHPAHIAKEGVATALSESVAKGRQQGMEWWTAKQINNWERARHKVAWSKREGQDDNSTICLSSGSSLAEATLLFLGQAATSVVINGQEHSSTPTTRWGFDFQAITIDIEQAKNYSIEVRSDISHTAPAAKAAG